MTPHNSLIFLEPELSAQVIERYPRPAPPRPVPGPAAAQASRAPGDLPRGARQFLSWGGPDRRRGRHPSSC